MHPVDLRASQALGRPKRCRLAVHHRANTASMGCDRPGFRGQGGASAHLEARELGKDGVELVGGDQPGAIAVKVPGKAQSA